MLFLIELLGGFLIGCIYSLFFLPNVSGGEPRINPTIKGFIWRGMIFIPISDIIAIHIHHWVLYLIVACSCAIIQRFYTIIGFSLCLTIQGLSYEDSMDFYKHNPYVYMISSDF